MNRYKVFLHLLVTLMFLSVCRNNSLLNYRICSIRRRSRLVAAYNSIGELNKIVAALEYSSRQKKVPTTYRHFNVVDKKTADFKRSFTSVDVVSA